MGLAPELWRFTIAKIRTSDDLKSYLDSALAERAQGVAVPLE